MDVISLNTTPVAGAKAPGPNERSTLGLVELFLKDRARLDSLLRDPAHEAELFPRLLAIALSGFTVFGITISIILSTAGLGLPGLPAVRWSDGSAFWLILAYDLGLVAACGVCLPSFYFFGLLAGVRTSMLQVTLQALRGLAATSVVLVGILPIHVAIALGLVIFEAPNDFTRQALYLGLALPFVAGLWGVGSIYRGFLSLARALAVDGAPPRECFLRRLIASWGACYTAVTPVMIYTLWRHFAA
jgi:hypothetical protein